MSYDKICETKYLTLYILYGVICASSASFPNRAYPEWTHSRGEKKYWRAQRALLKSGKMKERNLTNSKIANSCLQFKIAYYLFSTVVYCERGRSNTSFSLRNGNSTINSKTARKANHTVNIFYHWWIAGNPGVHGMKFFVY